MSIKKFRIISIVLTLAIMVLIFCLSAQNADESSSASDPITRIICSVFYSDFNSLPEANRLEILGNISFFVRKTAHFSIYFLLGASALLTALTFNKLKTALRPLASLAFCALYAAGDEIHQYFVPGRSCELRDALIDISGALLATVVILIALRLSAKFRNFLLEG